MATYSYKALNHDLGKALHRYEMISSGDRILVGVSGGKDSLTLLWLLNERLSRIPVSYTLHAVYVDPGFEGSFGGALKKWVDNTGISLRVEQTDAGVVAHSPANRENPCFLCSRRRRRRIFDVADELGCNKVAFGHHKDDIIETFFLNVCYTGVMGTMLPVQPVFDGRISIIRPLAFADEERIARFAKEQRFPEFVNPCPTADRSKRHEIKKLLNDLYGTNKKIKKNIFRSLSHVNLDYML